MSTSPHTAGASRLHALDSLRGAMMLLGIWLHATCSYVQMPLGRAWPFKDADTNPWLDFPLVLIHVFRMPLFFVMAGLFAALLWNRLAPAGFIRHRLRRIGIPFVAGWLLVFIPIQAGFFYAGNLQSAEPLRATLEFYRSGAFLRGMTTAHLWFLYYLLYLYLAAYVLCSALPKLVAETTRQRLDRRFRQLASSTWRPLFFAFPTAVTLLFMQSGGLDTEVGFVLTPKILAAYGVFFGFGWLLYGHVDLLAGFPRHAWKQVILALLLLPVNAGFVIATVKALPAYNPGPHFGAVVTGSVMVWLLIFGITGLFVRYLDRPDPRVRYVADASYWMYIVHLPLMIWIPVVLAPYRLPAIAKVSIVLGISLPVLLLSYHILVRYTFIGEVLNGKRGRSAEPVPPGKAAAAGI